MYVYVKSEPTLWTVGFYKPDGSWVSESDHESSEAAAERVARLNGAYAVNDTFIMQQMQEQTEILRSIQHWGTGQQNPL